MATHREVDNNGYLTVRGNPLSSFGVFDYSAGQLGLEGDPMRIVKVYRSEETVSNPETIESFKDVPLIIKHAYLSGDEESDDPDTVAPEDKGLDGVLTGNVYYEAPWLRGDIKVFSRKGRKAIKNGMLDLSLGYGCRFIQKPGVFEGQAYELEQVNMSGNHIALVPDGRVPGARVMDARVFDGKGGEVGVTCTIIEDFIFEGATMSKTKTATLKRNAQDSAEGGTAVQRLLALLPALQEFLQQEAKEPAHQENAEQGAAEGAAQAQPVAEQDAGEFGEEQTAEGVEQAAEAGAEQGAAASPDLASLIAQVEATLAELKAGCVTDSEGDGDEGQPGKKAEDAVEGLQEASGNSQLEANKGAKTEVAKASPGPEKGTHAKASDASVRAFYADLAAKDRLYNGVSKVVGAFDHRAMDAREVAAYGVKKLGLKNVTAGNEISAVELYLQGRDSADKNTATAVQKAADAAFQPRASGTGDPNLDAYLKGTK